MEIQFRLAWLKSGNFTHQAFKAKPAYELFYEYIGRISKFAPCRTLGSVSPDEIEKRGAKVWVCDSGTGSKLLSSEGVAECLQRLCDSGARELRIMIGGPDGFSKKKLEELKPDLRWSFGPLTLPHELAALVASEQIYRAFTIIRKMPYHSGH